MTDWYRVRAASAEALFAEGAVAVEPAGDDYLGHFLFRDEAGAAGEVEECAPPEWAAEWLSQQRSALASKRVFVCSSARPEAAPPGAVRVSIDPGLSFGDGFHPTTQMCLQALDDALRKNPAARVLDVGTGSGILAIAALLLGARSALGTDVDPDCLRAARRNANRSGVTRSALQLQTDFQAGRFELVAANVPEEVHAAIAPRLREILNREGTLILSGYMADRSPLVTARYERHGFLLVERREQSGWIATVWRPA